MGLIPDLTTTFDDGEGLQVSTDASSLDFLQAVYRNPEVQLPVRMRAAGMACLLKVQSLPLSLRSMEATSQIS
jgi:hypothetical protein